MLLYDLSNELMAQKDEILGLVNEKEFEKAKFLLGFCYYLWDKCGYRYKYLEIKQRIKDGIQHEINHATHHKTIEKWERILKLMDTD